MFPKQVVVDLRATVADRYRGSRTINRSLPAPPRPFPMSHKPAENPEDIPHSEDHPDQTHMKHPKGSFPIVGIGASAGGLAALKKLFAHVPADSGMAYVVVVHLSPEHKSHLAELLQPHVHMPVQQVTKTIPVKKNHVYVIPPNSNLTAIDTHLRLTELERERRERAPIDHFFRTMAKTHDGDAICMILTGTGSDGTLGLKEIKEFGGLTIVQDPTEAEFDGMPQSAVATGLVDLILPLAKIPDAILHYVQTKPNVKVPADDEPPPEETEQFLMRVLAQIRSRTHRDFTRYKRSTLLRRITRRMQFNHIEEQTEYLELLRKQPEEVMSLADDLLITVTSFFRDKEVFELLEQDVIPGIFSRKRPGDVIRVWTVGCATGEEAYSLAILLLEEAARREENYVIQIFASDLHEHSLLKAREAFYPGDIETDVSHHRLKKFFEKQDGGYRIRKEVRELVVFAPHNLLGDPPFSQIDLVTCRNVMIYLQRELQKDVIELFHYALNPEGILLLGTSETIDGTDLFRVVNKTSCTYQKRNVPAPEPRLPVFPLVQTRHFRDTSVQALSQKGTIAYGVLHQRLVEQFAPPSMLVSPDDRIVHLSEHAGRFLIHPGGEPTLNVYRLVREELRVELQTGLHRARQRREAMTTRPIYVRFNGQTGYVVLHVRPALEQYQEGYALVIFEDRELSQAEQRVAFPPQLDPAEIPDAEVLGRMREQDVEIEQTRQRLQAIIEEYETSQEEMKASNEELQSSNEELRSTMEELETSKEELQSMNEELQTVNQENRHKVEELEQLSGDLQNLLASTDIATLFLDREFRILRFTPRVGELFRVRMTDRGRPLSDFAHRLGYNRLLEDAEQVLRKLIPIEREIEDQEHRWYLTRILPYRSMEDRIEGVVITFVEITARKTAEENVLRHEERFRTLVAQVCDYAIFMTDPQGRGTTWNEGVRRVLGFEETEFIGQDITEIIFLPEDVADGVPDAELREAAETGTGGNERWMRRKDGSRFWASGVTTSLRDDEGHLLGFMKVMRDQTERKELEDELQRTAGELAQGNRRKDEFLALLAHELRNPLAPIRSGVDLMRMTQDPKVIEEARDTIARQTEQLITIVDDLLDISRITRGKLQLRRRPMLLQDAIRGAVESSRVLIEEKGHEFFVIPPDQATVVDADPTRLTQVIANLLNNAAKYTPPGGNIHLALGRVENLVKISVADNGIGIPADMVNRVFEMFAQIEQSEKFAESGLGIGLTLVKSLVEMHGGRIEVTSDGLNQGTTFTVWLPYLQDFPIEQLSESSETEETATKTTMRVLVVDDNHAAAKMLSMTIGNLGHDVRIAHDGQAGLDAAAEFRPELVLMDIGMPNMDGHTAARRLRQESWGQGIRLIALTGWGQEIDRQKALDAGFDDHMVKPIDPSDLRQLFE